MVTREGVELAAMTSLDGATILARPDKQATDASDRAKHRKRGRQREPDPLFRSLPVLRVRWADPHMLARTIPTGMLTSSTTTSTR